MPGRKELVDAAKNLNEVLDADPPIDVKKGIDEIKREILEAAGLLTESDVIKDNTRKVIDELTAPAPEAKAKPAKADAPKPKKASKENGAPKKKEEVTPPEKKPGRAPRSSRQLGAFKPVRANTSLHKIMEGADKGHTVARIAKDAALREDQVRHRLRHVLRINHGIDFSENDKGKLALVFPDGKTLKDAVRSAA